MQNKVKIRIVISILFSAVFLYVFFKSLNKEELYRYLNNINIYYVLLGFLFYTISSFLRAYRWHMLIKDIDMREFFFINNIHIALNNILPARTGELGFFFLLKKKGITLTKSFWVFLLARLMDGLALLGIFLGFFTNTYIFPFYIMIFGLFSIVVLKYVFKLIPKNLFKSLRENLKGHFEINTAFRLYGISVISFFVKFLGFYIAYKNIINKSFFDVLPSYVFAELSSILPINGVMGFGTYELGFVSVGFLENIKLDNALTLGFLTHIFLLLSSSFLGLVSMLFIRLESQSK